MRNIIQPAKQDRSRETQERILLATKRLLKTELFESISIRRIVEEANTSIGSFYSRFPDKNALLPVLYQAYDSQLNEDVEQLRSAVERAHSLNELTELIVDHFVELSGMPPNLSRALYEYVTQTRDAAYAAQVGSKRMKQYSFLIDSILRFEDEIQHTEPARAAHLSLYFTTVICRNRLLYPMAPQTQALKISKKELRTELRRMLRGYLRGE